MKNLNDLTVIIVTYRTSEKVILDCLNSIDSNVGIIIVENSNHFKHSMLTVSCGWEDTNEVFNKPF